MILVYLFAKHFVWYIAPAVLPQMKGNDIDVL